MIDSILIDMSNRSPKTTMEMLCDISSLSPNSSTFLEVRELKDLCKIS
jgi:hypothetical protein